MKILKILLASTIFLFLTSFSIVSAADGDLIGTASSALIGDINLAGVNFSTVSGVGSGTASSTRLGPVSFNEAEVKSNNDCPTISSGDTSTNCSGPKITWNSDGSGVMKGYVRFCAVFTSPTGCSGALKPDYLTGGWDGFIALGDGTATNSGWGVKVSATVNADNTRNITGYAWGSDVVGWVSFNGKINDTPGVSSITASSCIIAINQSTCDTSISGDAQKFTPSGTTVKKGSAKTVIYTLTAKGVFGPISNIITHGTTTFYLEDSSSTPNTLAQADAVANCASGSAWNGVSCVANPVVCQPGQYWNGTSCVNIPSCSAGQYWNGTSCVNIPSCSAGQYWNGTACTICVSPKVVSSDGLSCIDKPKPKIKEF